MTGVVKKTYDCPFCFVTYHALIPQEYEVYSKLSLTEKLKHDNGLRDAHLKVCHRQDLILQEKEKKEKEKVKNAGK